MIVALATLTYAIIEGPDERLAVGADAGPVRASSLAAFAGLVAYELRRSEPLIEVRFFRSAPFSGASAIAVCAFAALGGFLFLNTLYLQDVRGLSPLDAGLYTLPMAALMLVDRAAVRAARRQPRGPACRWSAAASALIASGAILTQLTATTPFAVLIVAYAAVRARLRARSTRRSPTPRSRGCRPRRPGVAAAVASTSRQVGQTLGVAVLGRPGRRRRVGAIGPVFAAATHVQLVDRRRARGRGARASRC